MWWDILYVTIGLIVGIVVGFFIAKKIFQKQLKENPPINEEMIKTLMNCYQEYTHDYKSQPMAIGGGTYAKECQNTIAFGSAFPGRNDKIHDANESIHLSDFEKSISIYATAIMYLSKL